MLTLVRLEECIKRGRRGGISRLVVVFLTTGHDESISGWSGGALPSFFRDSVQKGDGWREGDGSDELSRWQQGTPTIRISRRRGLGTFGGLFAKVVPGKMRHCGWPSHVLSIYSVDWATAGACCRKWGPRGLGAYRLRMEHRYLIRTLRLD